MKFVDLAESLKEGLMPIYFLRGEEAYFRDRAVAAIRAACALQQPALNEVRIEGESLKGDKLAAFRDGLYVLPFLDERRLVRVYEFYPTEREWEGVFARYAERPSPSTVLVIVNSGKRAGGADLAKKKGVVLVDCARESEEKLSRWLFALLRRMGLQADADAAGMMVRYCACDAARLHIEAEKLKLLLGEGGRVDRAAVDAFVAKDVEYKVYELTQAASRGSHSAFCEILSELMNKGMDENAVLAALTSHYCTLVEIGRMRGTDAEVSKLLGVKPYAVAKNREAARRLGGRAEKIYQRLYALSADMRTGLYGKEAALQAAVTEIFFG